MTHQNTALKYNLDSATHPVEDGSYLIPTPPICELSEKVMRLIKMRAPGAMVYGPQRFGKSRGIRYICGDILDEFGEDFPVFSFTCRKYSTPTEPTFWGDILRDLGHTEADSGTAWQKRVRLKSFILDRVFAAKQKRVVFIADEGQKLRYLQFEWLQDLYNDLDAEGISPVFILFGQKQLLQMRSAFVNSGEMQIVGRFMVHSYAFRGLRSQSDVAQCLYGYDEGSEYPMGSGSSFTRHFFPKAFDNGWRLGDEAENIWNAFMRIRAENKMSQRFEIPMQYFIATMNFALVEYADHKQTSPVISLNMWKEAVKSSGYAEIAICEANTKKS